MKTFRKIMDSKWSEAVIIILFSTIFVAEIFWFGA